MDETRSKTELRRWRDIVAGVGVELSNLPPEEKGWLAASLARIADCQRELHDFFLRAGGAGLCLACAGDCCGCGKNHLTLVNLLGLLTEDDHLPEPDFARTCPFLGETGCLIDVGRRPFNCVTFLCEEVEDRLTPPDREAFYHLESRLRSFYAEFDRRYAGSSLCGIFIRSENLAGRPFLGSPKIA